MSVPDDLTIGAPETSTEVHVHVDDNATVEVEPPHDTPVIEAESVTVEAPVLDDVETAQEPVEMSSNTGSTEESPVVENVEKEVEPKPDTRPKRKLGWRAFILGGSGGTK